MRSCRIIFSLFQIVGMFLVSPFYLQGQPSYGLVVSRDGEIIFTDAFHNQGTLWKVSSGGNLSVVATGQECSYLFKDKEEWIWGNNIPLREREGEKRFVFWKLEDSGMFKEPGVLKSFSWKVSPQDFVVDSKEIFYFVSAGCLFKGTLSTSPEIVADFKEEGLSSVYMDGNDSLYVSLENYKGGSIIQIYDDKSPRLIAKDLLASDSSVKGIRKSQARLFGLYKDKKGFMFVANGLHRSIIRIAPSGEEEVFYRSVSPWFPVSIVNKGRRYFILEVGFDPQRGFMGPRVIRKKGNKLLVLANAEEWEKKPIITSSLFRNHTVLEHLLVVLLLVGSVVFLFVSAKRR